MALTLAAVAVQAEAQTFFAATDGNDLNPGTRALPFRTINKGIRVLSPGATLYIMDGTYPESILTWQADVPSGTSWDAPVTIAAYPGSRVILRPDSGPNVIDLGSTNHYMVFDGLVLDAINVTFTSTEWGNGIYVGPRASFIRVTNTEILNAPGQGIFTAGQAHWNEFLNLTVHDNGRVRQLTHGFYISSSNNLIQGCKIFNNAAYGLQVYGPGLPSNNVIRGNTIFDNERMGNGGGIDISSGAGNMAINNIIWGHPDPAITVAWGNPTDSKILNNTIVNKYGIFINSDSARAVVQNNIINGANTAIDDQGTGTIASNNLATDPMFVDASHQNFHLQAGSPAIDTGGARSEVTDDIENTPRPLQRAFDIGAYEYKSPTSAPTPPTRVRLAY